MNPTTKAVALAKLKPVAWNPRLIKDERFKNLCASIEADPEFLWRRPVLATLDGSVYAGNMRYRAAAHLGHATIPAIVEDIPETLAKERALRDNGSWGEWNEDELSELIYNLSVEGSDTALLGFDQAELDRLIGIVEPVDFPDLPEGGRNPFRTMTFTVSADQEEAISEALDRAKQAGPFMETGNENSNGNALARLAEAYQ